jgi:hypothetical protein
LGRVYLSYTPYHLDVNVLPNPIAVTNLNRWTQRRAHTL